MNDVSYIYPHSDGVLWRAGSHIYMQATGRNVSFHLGTLLMYIVVQNNDNEKNMIVIDKRLILAL